MTDKNKIAENNLYAELAFALGKKKNEMQKLIDDRMKEIGQVA